MSAAILSAPYVLEYTYRRSVGPVLGRFFAGLRDGRILGARTASGRVIVPPTEFDPDTAAPLEGELVDVGTSGTVTSFTWVAQPTAKHPLARPFAWALVKLDGADTALLHAVDAGDESKLKVGARVRARWKEAREGEIADLACFELTPSEGGAR